MGSSDKVENRVYVSNMYIRYLNIAKKKKEKYVEKL